MAKLGEDALKDLVEYLSGSSQSLDNALKDYNLKYTDLSEEDWEYIDQEIFNCENCGWWLDRSEESLEEDDVCDECAADNREDENDL